MIHSWCKQALSDVIAFHKKISGRKTSDLNQKCTIIDVFMIDNGKMDKMDTTVQLTCCKSGL